MKLSRESLLRESQESGFRPEILEKSIHLLNLLGGFQKHPFLADRLALKGGTALNLFFFDLPRLSIDIDLNYLGGGGKEELAQNRPRIEQAIQAVCLREGFQVSQLPQEHAGGKWRLRYESALGGGANLELDVNFMFRIPLWPVVKMNSHRLGTYQAVAIPLLDIHEIAAGKLAALLSRHASRDVFDAKLLFSEANLDSEKLRLGFVVYGAMNRKDWRTISLDEGVLSAKEVEAQLIPVLRKDFAGQGKSPRKWAEGLLSECRGQLKAVLPLSPAEREFLDRLLDRGEIEPTLLTSDSEMADRILQHPLLQWKALNVRKHKL